MRDVLVLAGVDVLGGHGAVVHQVTQQRGLSGSDGARDAHRVVQHRGAAAHGVVDVVQRAVVLGGGDHAWREQRAALVEVDVVARDVEAGGPPGTRRRTERGGEYRKQRLKKRIISLLAIIGIKINNSKNDGDDDLYEEFKKFSKE